MHHGPTSWLLALPLLPSDSHYLHVNGAIVVFLILTIFSSAAYLSLKSRGDDVVPPSRFSIGGVADLLMEFLYGLVHGVMGHHGNRHLSFIAAIFIFILVSNLLGLLPLGSSPTSHISTTAALALVSFAYYNVAGIRAHGVRNYIGHLFMGLTSPVLLVIGVLVAIIEVISHLIRPITLALRLFINLDVDHKLLMSFQELVAWLIPIPILLFGLVVCTLQAFLFAILSTVYIQLATEHE